MFSRMYLSMGARFIGHNAFGENIGLAPVYKNDQATHKLLSAILGASFFAERAHPHHVREPSSKSYHTITDQIGNIYLFKMD